MVLDGLLTILQSLFGWLFLLILQLLLKIVDIVESFFNVFAGTTEVYYYGEPEYLFNLFFTSAGITNLFWAMVIIAVILSFGFCIVAVARKVTDISGTTKHTLGQIISNFIRSLVVILLLNICIIAALNVTGVILTESIIRWTMLQHWVMVLKRHIQMKSLRQWPEYWQRLETIQRIHQLRAVIT